MIPLKYPTIMSGIVVRWRFAPPLPYDAEINASRDGVSICGCWPIMSGKVVAEVTTTLGMAVAAHERLRKGDPLAEISDAPVFGDPNPEPLNEPISRQARLREETSDDD